MELNLHLRNGFKNEEDEKKFKESLYKDLAWLIKDPEKNLKINIDKEPMKFEW